MLSIEDVPLVLREVEGRTISALPAWAGSAISRAIQQPKEDSRAKGIIIANVQILIDVFNRSSERGGEATASPE